MRTTIDLDDELVRAAQRLAGTHDIAALVHAGLRELIERESARREDEEDLAAFDERAGEPSVSYEVFLAQLRSEGMLGEAGRGDGASDGR